MKMARIRISEHDKKKDLYRWVLLDDAGHVVCGSRPMKKDELAGSIGQAKRLFGRPLGISTAK